MAKKLTTTDAEAIRQLDWLSQRFDAISNLPDAEIAKVALWAQQAFAANLLQRLGIIAPWDDGHFSHLSQEQKKTLEEALRESDLEMTSIDDGPTELELFKSGDARARNNMLRFRWCLEVAILNISFPDETPWGPGSPRTMPTGEVTLALCFIPDECSRFNPLQRIVVQSLYFGEFCRWLAWLIRTKSLPQVKKQVKEANLSEDEIKAVYELYEKKPEAQLKDIKEALVVGSDKAQAAKNLARQHGIDQSRPRKKLRR